MIRIALQICLTVMALLISASVSVAAECADDPNECTPKKLCEIATETYGSDGNTSWSAAASEAKHVTFAQGLGMTCGVIAALDPCDSDPNECKISQLCDKATTESAGQVSWNDSAAVYVAVAKEYGLSCGVKAEVKKTCSASNPEVCNNIAVCAGAKHTQSKNLKKAYVEEANKRGLDCGLKAEVKKSCSSNTPEACLSSVLCGMATMPNGSYRKWTKISKRQGFVKEAKKRGLTCGVQAEVEKTCSASNPEVCDNFAVCAGAKHSFSKDLKKAYADEAKKRGINCGLKAEVEKTCSASNPEVCNNIAVCAGAKHTQSKNLKKAYVEEANKRGLSCGVKVNTRNAQGELPDCPLSGVFHNCYGTYTWSSGLKYVGEWKDDERNGQGTETYTGGQKYVGEFKDDKRNGQGTFTWPDGQKYVGGFKNDLYHGQGTLTLSNGSIKKGIWKNDELVSPAVKLFDKNDFNALNTTRRKQLQYGLKKLGYYTSSIDGKYGPNTQRAVRGYAEAKGITSGYPNSVYNRLVLDVNVPSSFASTQQSTGGSSPSSGGSDAGKVLRRGAAIALVCALTPNAAACLDGAMGNMRKYGSSNSSSSSTFSPSTSNDKQCSFDSQCGFRGKCVKRLGKSMCVKIVDEDGRKVRDRDAEPATCRRNSDCSRKFKCDRTYKVCVKK